MKEEKLTEAVVGKVQDAALTEARLEQICDAALELFLEKGFASTTIRDICARSGVNQASIYDYIANKNDILRRLLNRLWFEHDVPSLAERLNRQGERALTDIIADYLKETWSHKRQGTLLVYRSVPYLQADDRRAMRARDEAVIATLAERLRERAGLPEQDRRPEVMANLIIFISAFAPMRDWLGRDIDDELMLRTVAAGVAAMIEELARG
ncbi:TetR/AcrR family transcriptional regulator [Alloalcanivorax gelatiniphagus]|uniref:TetR/AcrR family transcriptional regulator n=1 Tax=Alloalcanivorax gelatiniphagus TaxID=1194167 RepID=A0ABY2XNI3_9GAMM|nr:TetR/AcrR family transcriptional regulator [Alloalcanivorax gelatiniphagus]TMW13997.1 TetR/AcrR family transcriptional regulator [Alloalcanivorax gelatiniphagus]|tara:strand:- start:11 stop:643 length:633 start_codon:yes stop_codon:yes gene_type:complete